MSKLEDIKYVIGLHGIKSDELFNKGYKYDIKKRKVTFDVEKPFGVIALLECHVFTFSKPEQQIVYKNITGDFILCNEHTLYSTEGKICIFNTKKQALKFINKNKLIRGDVIGENPAYIFDFDVLPVYADVYKSKFNDELHAVWRIIYG